MLYSQISKIAHVVERKHSVKHNGLEYFFNAPNYPIDLIRKDASSMGREAELCARRENTHDFIERNDLCRKIKRGEKMVGNITFNEFWGLKKSI